MHSKQNLYKANTIPIKELLIKLNEPIKEIGKSIRWEKHNSVSINDNLWYQHSLKRGGLPVDFLTTFFNYSKEDAISFILSKFELADVTVDDLNSNILLKPPPKNSNSRIIEIYLKQFRFLDNSIVDEFINQKLIYEDRKYHNCIFVGKDIDGTVKHIHRHSTHLSKIDLKGNLDGSDGRYSFNWIGSNNSLFVFEAPIDLLSYITLNNENWQQNSYVALCGLSSQAIHRILNDVPSIKKVVLCLDNDSAGQEITSQLQDELRENSAIEISIKYPRFKDFNEDLKFIHNQPVTLGLREPFYQFVDDALQTVVKLSHKEKDKSLKDLMDSISVVYYGVNFTSPKQIEKYRNVLLESGRNALMLARQQYRHFEIRHSMDDMVDLLKDESDPFMKYCEHDKKLAGFTKELDTIKTLFITKIYLTEDEKNQLIEALMSLAKRCIYTHVFLSLNERKIINDK
ncbi:DUF3991 domain-containing protein [Erysipelothrix sp. HDW6B]|uniref:DUF3991 and toprim domain-containing protein n=1 Tax=Erysipelothrix sp. HDW6B TaxID=2714929 RepID=UPI00140CC1DD|nr:DUF3991 and toprim domain-containing protein [Erysipelothrix sp. HDW6B]QIK86636.1 DUF3991 domain-containing protein [Erysipelothrix sp. HDW6B]